MAPPRSTSHRRRIVPAVVAAVALVLTLPLLVAPAAGAATGGAATGGGSIVFIKQNNVWISDGDGGHQRRVTTDGTAAKPWSSPTQSDKGIVVAGRGSLVYRMDQSGNVLTTLDLPALRDSAGNLLDGAPARLAISPDGSKIAYTYRFYSCDWGCYVRAVTSFTSSTAVSPSGTWGVTHYDNPEWVSGSRVIVDGWLTEIVRFFDLGRGDFFWFDENSYTTDDKVLDDPALSPDGKFVAAVRDEFENSNIIWYQVTGNPKSGARPPIPTPKCATNPQVGYANPTFSADSTALAWEEPDGIWRVDQLAPVDCSTVQAKRIVPGGSQPSWSKASIQPYKPGRPSKPQATKRLVVKKSPTISGKHKVGARLRASKGTWSAKPSSYSYRWYRGRKAIAKAKKSTYRVTKKDRGRTITVRVTVKRKGWTTAHKTSKPIKIPRKR